MALCVLLAPPSVASAQIHEVPILGMSTEEQNTETLVPTASSDSLCGGRIVAGIALDDVGDPLGYFASAYDE
jgi:hypothetical protein